MGERLRKSLTASPGSLELSECGWQAQVRISQGQLRRFTSCLMPFASRLLLDGQVSGWKPGWSRWQTHLRPPIDQTIWISLSPFDSSRSSPDREDFAEQVHDALARLNDPVYLQAHPLVRFVRTDLNARSSNRGRALQQALLDAIESLRPGAAGVPNSRALRRYEVLRLRFVEGLEISQILDRLSISRSGYFLEQQQALKTVASRLFETWIGSGPIPSETPSRTRESGRRVAPDIERGGEQPRSLVRAQTNLPLQLTSFVGRERELAEVKRLLGTTRLLTFTGAGGCGKTRLAYQVAFDLPEGTPEEYPDGVWLVELAALSDPEPRLPDGSLEAGSAGGAWGADRVEPRRPPEDASASFSCSTTASIWSTRAPSLSNRSFGRVLACGFLATSRELLGVYGRDALAGPFARGS